MSFPLPLSRKQSYSETSHSHSFSHHHTKSTHSINSSSTASNSINNNNNSNSHGGPPPPPPVMSQTNSNSASSVGNIIYQHIHDMASKRISTLDYLRKAHEGNIHYFNTFNLSSQAISLLPSHLPPRAPRITHSLFLLGLSLPTILDLNATTPLEYLRALNTLLLEFEAYTSLHHSAFGSSSTNNAANIARNAAMKVPALFKQKRAASTSGPSGRRSSAAGVYTNTAAETPHLPFPAPSESGNGTPPIPETPSGVSSVMSTPMSPPSAMSLNSQNDMLLPNESYTHLLTPQIPFQMSFHEVFCTLCDVLIDTYTRLLQLVATPSECTPTVGEVFSKADARVRKAVVSGVVREFEEVGRKGAREEVLGLGRMVVGGFL